ncbi:aldo/keto reductase [Oscillochloris sp. ZM17-4]|uniref:aldo/keto reductase n=1 Tax=Oscillochloris sp. ZM17-4 TaxID=2866714 RepID=UPI001C73C07D|nr:aldo/keto reductase [Oscillochloris sp. ZM17-4]MBX0329325.1 aldo/keto reductase [Oscillochloris sp. ZM17-4]
MEMRTLGRSGLKVAPICLGGNVFGWTCDEPASYAVLDAYVAGGGNFIDSADVYSRWAPGNSGGDSELIIGRWMRERRNRAEIVLATKVGSAMGDAPHQRGLSRRHIIAGVEDSLRRLQTDYIDLYQAHIDDDETPLDETLRAFDDLVRAGKVRYLGASNYSAWRLTRALWESDRRGYAPYICVQPRYNLIDRADFERELGPMCQELGVGVIGYSSVASGFLSGKYRRGGPMPTSARAGGVQQRYMNDRGFAVLDAVLKVAEAHDATPTQVALAWLLAQPAVTSPIASATSPQQTTELIGAVGLRLTPEDLAALSV